MRVLILCEFSGALRQSFQRHGHTAVSVDLRPGEGDGAHVMADAIDYSRANCQYFDLVIAHPVCRYLTNAGVKWLYRGGTKENGKDPDRWHEMYKAVAFFRALQELPVPFMAIENPIMHGHARKLVAPWPMCSIQPWQFGRREKKRTCFWLKNLPPLVAETDLLEETNALPMKEQQRVFYMGPGANREKERSRTLPGIAAGIARQWGDYVERQL